jgi:hypothetical protein
MFAVAIIVIAIVHGTIRYLIRINQQVVTPIRFDHLFSLLPPLRDERRKVKMLSEKFGECDVINK